MTHKMVLLLNLAILLANFALSWGSTEAQVRVLRTTARVAHGFPLLSPRSPETGSPGGVPEARLLRYLGGLSGLDRLTPRQIATVYGCLDYCCRTAEEGGQRLREGALDGAATRSHIERLQEQMRSGVKDSLRAAEIEDRRLLGHLVRILVSSTG
ncbi:MAG: hypothetical protein ACYSX0_01180 [Planctomycetota bacterium]|jgi:hypothetical protein